MSGKRLGIVRIKLAAELLESLPGASIDIGGTVRTPVLGGSAMLGFTEQIKESVVECETATISAYGSGHLICRYRWNLVDA